MRRGAQHHNATAEMTPKPAFGTSTGHDLEETGFGAGGLVPTRAEQNIAELNIAELFLVS